MKSQYLLALILTVTMTGFSFDWHGKCLNTYERMSCNMTVHSVNVTIGENLILTCTCSNKTNGQWMGPKKAFSDSGDSVPFTQGLELNNKLNKSKYTIFGGYEIKKCNLKITNFLSEDDGAYQCTYTESSTMYIDVYNLVATSTRSFADMSTTNYVVTSTEPDICTFENKYLRSNSVKFYGFVCMLIGSLVGGGLLFSICFNVYCILKRKQNSGIVPEFPSEVQYYDIGSIYDNSANIRTVPNNVQEADASVNRPASQRTNSSVSSFENTSSSQPYVQNESFTLMNERVYEKPYHVIDPVNIETHLYGILRSNMYQNTIIFQNEITNKTAERDPWLIIYENTSVNDLK